MNIFVILYFLALMHYGFGVGDLFGYKKWRKEFKLSFDKSIYLFYCYPTLYLLHTLILLHLYVFIVNWFWLVLAEPQGKKNKAMREIGRCL